MRPLTPRQERFVEEYLLDLNATRAALRAGYKHRDMGRQLLTHPHVVDAIASRKLARGEQFEVKAEHVLRELVRLASVDVTLAFNADGSMKPLDEIPLDTRRAIAGIEIEEERYGKDGELVRGRVKKLRFTTKDRALELLGKHLGLFVDTKIEVNLSWAALAEAAWKKPVELPALPERSN